MSMWNVRVDYDLLSASQGALFSSLFWFQSQTLQQLHRFIGPAALIKLISGHSMQQL